MKTVALAMTDQEERADAIRTISGFVHGYSIEATRPSADDIAGLGGIVPKGTSVYVSAVPTQREDEAVEHASRLRRAGFEPVPHIAVRAFASANEIDRFLARLAADAGVRQVLVIAGDRDPPAGSLRSALDVIDSGLLQRHGVLEAGIAGYPEGHPRIPGHELDRALADKIATAEATGLRLHIVTQFCFDADAIIGWIRRLRDFGFDVPVRIGLAGPTSLPTLMRYASRCGVPASVHGLARHAGLMRQLFAMSAPDALVRALAAERERLGDVQAHFFSFGGLARTARWASAVELGHIALEPGQGFRVEPAG
ncbi:MAG: methylenetetrahydrofolate reductase [Rhizobiales bacterium]|nr:methylenetetrahydrofolate reductase [Hyphomicrobiales bacterium]